MKFKLWSDLHTEGRYFDYKPEDRDIDLTLILAGDIGTINTGLTLFLIEMCDYFKHVIYVYGNHEFYHSDIQTVKNDIIELTKTVQNLHVLDNQKVIIDGVRILGTPLWTNFGENPVVMNEAPKKIFDFTVIETIDGHEYIDDTHIINRRNVEPEDYKLWFDQAIQWLKYELAKDFDGKTMVVTHWSPTHKLTEPRFAGNFLNPYFTNDLDYLFHYYDIDTWCYGHTHGKIFIDYDEDDRFDGTRIINNPKGYAHEEVIHQLNPKMKFEPKKIFEI